MSRNSSNHKVLAAGLRRPLALDLRTSRSVQIASRAAENFFFFFNSSFVFFYLTLSFSLLGLYPTEQKQTITKGHKNGLEENSKNFTEPDPPESEAAGV